MLLSRIRQFLWLTAVLALGFGLLPAAAFAQSPSPLSPASTSADSISNLYWRIFLTALVIYLFVQGLILYSAFRFRRRSDALPPQIFGHTRLEMAWTIAPFMVLLVILYLTVQVLGVTRYTAEAGTDDLEVQVIGHQWFWEYRYPKQGAIADEIITAADLVVPVGQRVHLRIWSDDVIHSFWIPQLAGKTDANPVNFAQEGQVGPGVKQLNTWFQATQPGVYEGQCAEYCGEQHAIMRMRVKVVDRAGWDEWVKRNTAPAQPQAAGFAIDRGRQVFLDERNLCVSCHTIKGTTAAGKVGPNLSNVGGRQEIGAGALTNTPENLHTWIRNAPGVKSGIKMPAFPQLTDADLDALVAYLSSLK